MPNSFPIDGPAGVGIAEPTLGVFQVQVTADQAANSRSGIALTVAGDGQPGVIYPRRNQTSDGYDWYFTRSQQDKDGLALAQNGDVTFGRNVTIKGKCVSESPASFSGGLTVGTSFQVQGDAAVAGKLQVTGPLEVNNTVTFKGDIAVGGALKLKDWEITVPDYVFRPGHPLLPLDQVSDFIGAHGHLPEVPSAAELVRDGMDAAHMLLTLLKKVEELTLHLLAQEHRLKAVEAGAVR